MLNMISKHKRKVFRFCVLTLASHEILISCVPSGSQGNLRHLLPDLLSDSRSANPRL
jgi:hypothetical protein